MRYRMIMMIITIFTIPFIQSCTGNIKTGTLPELKGGSPLSGISPVRFVVNKFEDKRADFHGVATIQETDLYQVFENDSFLTHGGIDRKVSDLIFQAIVSELKRNGHMVLELNDQAEVVIGGIILQYHIERQKIGVWKGGLRMERITALVKVNVTVVNRLKSEEILSKTYSGISLKDAEVTVELVATLLNEALLNMVKDFTTDIDFLDALKKIEQAKGSDNMMLTV